ncbi:MAG: DNA-protecting protein DprA [Deltaproteobacteria bacterium]|nr:DNA-protecting protein DprA [Deltaproteobacteria bacterium]
MTDTLPWLALKGIPGVGWVLFERLTRAFGNPGAVFSASEAALLAVKGVSPAMAQAIRSFRDWDRLERHLERVRAVGAQVVTAADPAFPPGLKQIPYPPAYLYVQGAVLPEDAWAVALVGTRAASYYGLKTCRRLARDLASRGITVVSGLARGIDTAAHQGALEAGGRTLAVLGCGVDVSYPPENRELAGKISRQGALLSEFPLGTPPEPQNFPVRNRLISGLSLAVVVVEAGERSGAGITARLGLEQGREVMAVPGPLDSPVSAGPHRLIQQGAKLVRQADDILAELPRQPPPNAQPAESRQPPTPRPGRLILEDPLLPWLGSQPLQLDELVELSRLPAAEVMSRLTLLELQGLVRELPGKCYVLNH